jgi:hypothetical protein
LSYNVNNRFIYENKGLGFGLWGGSYCDTERSQKEM